jgi:hypothetical protein
MSLPENALKKQFTGKELLAVSKKTSKRFTPVMPEKKADGRLTQQQLLEVSHNISLYYAPRILSDTHTLALLSIDPEHFYVYWNLADSHAYQCAHGYQEDDLKLRVFSHDNEYQQSSKARLLYETSISATQARQKITVKTTDKAVVYSASLGKLCSENRFIALVNSNEIHSFHETCNPRYLHESEGDSSRRSDQKIINPKPLSATSHFASPWHSGKGIQKE